MHVQTSVKIRSPGDKLVRRKGILRLIVQKGTKGRTPGKQRNKTRQG